MRWRDRRLRRVGAGLVLVLTSVLASAPALAAFLDPATTDATFTSETLAPPTGLTLAAGCTLLVPNITATWSATPSAWADGYALEHATSPTGPWTMTSVSGASTTTATIEGLAAGTTYHVRLRAVKGGWSSSYTPTASVTTKTLNLLGTICV